MIYDCFDNVIRVQPCTMTFLWSSLVLRTRHTHKTFWAYIYRVTITAKAVSNLFCLAKKD